MNVCDGPKADLTLYLALGPDDCAGRDPVAIACAAAKGGVTLVQIRDKNGSAYNQWQLAQRMRRALPANIPIIINDRADIALAANADGVHVGQTDLPAGAVRRLVGNKIVGLSITTAQDAHEADYNLIDHVGFGACFATATKADAVFTGLELLKALRPKIPCPIVGIGGITVENAASVIYAGANGICVVSAICRAENPQYAAAALRDAIAPALQRRQIQAI